MTLVFITNLARYAIQGYEVDASDFILKPLEYDRFRVRMDKLAARLPGLKGGACLRDASAGANAG